MKQTKQQTAAVVIIGNEVLSGKVEETNSGFLIRRFRELGVRLRRVEIIADEVEEIGDALNYEYDLNDKANSNVLTLVSDSDLTSKE